VAPESPAPAAVNRAAAAPVADSHAGHVIGEAPKPATPVAPRVAAPRAASRTAKPAASDSHAGHAVPALSQPPAPASAAAEQAITTPDNPAARLADLTCRPRVDPDTAPRATYLGKAYYFCTIADRDVFLKAPAKYLESR
jgi:YHS domain-containing protein